MSPRLVFVLVLLALAALAATVLFELFGESEAPPEAPTSIIAALSGADTTGFARVTGPRPLRFPEDHGPHEDHQIEWWYFTGNLEDDAGSRYGFQLTFFRTGLAPAPVDRESKLGATQMYMAHFALTDGAGGRFFAHDRFSRAALDLAGARAAPFAVWTETWSARSSGAELFPMQLTAREGATGIALRLEEGHPMILQGDAGYSKKGDEASNASYYLSYTRLPVNGEIILDGKPRRVKGTAWMDHEWSTSVLGDELAGWDWFSLQLDDGRELMLYQMRRKDGAAGSHSYGLLADASGARRKLGAQEFDIEVLDRWTSPHTGATYPARWKARVPSLDVELEITPLIPDQELRVAVAYWEGAVVVSDPEGATSGRGYVELVGYVEEDATN